MKFFATFFAAATVAAILTGCCCSAPQDETPTIVASYAPGLKVDGSMSDPAWKKAAAYRLTPYVQHDTAPEKTAAAVANTKYWNEVTAKVLYDDTNIYVGFDIQNDDIRAIRPEDQQLLYRYGDTMEVFLKPAATNSYAELYATPSGNKTSLIFPSRAFSGSVLQETQKVLDGLKVYSHVDGTLNNPKDTDKGWTTVMVIPRKALAEAVNSNFDGKTEWTMLLAGYCYSQNQIYGSNFSYPLLPKLSYHLTEYYANLVFEK